MSTHSRDITIKAFPGMCSIKMYLFLSFMFIYIQKIKVRYEFVQEILTISEQYCTYGTERNFSYGYGCCFIFQKENQYTKVQMNFSNI